MGLEGRTAIVTGGGRGIGRAIAARLLSQGMRVALLELDPEAGRQAQEELAGFGGVHLLTADVADEGQVERAVREAVARLGGLHLLVNNAGVMASRPLAELPLSEWNRVLGVNLTGPMLCAKHAAPHLRASNGAVVNIASTRALQSEPDTEAYAASKGGLVALTHALAVSLGPEVRVNCVSPGWIETGDAEQLSETDHRQHPAGRVGRPEDVAALVAFLADPENGFVTGANFVVDGGMTRKMTYQ